MKKKPEEVDQKTVLKNRLKESRRQLKELADNLEMTETLASDLMVIRRTRVIIDDCKRRLAE